MESRKFWRFALCLENPSLRRETITTTIRRIISCLNPETRPPGQATSNRPIQTDTNFKERKKNSGGPRNLWLRVERTAGSSGRLLIIRQNSGSYSADTITGWTQFG